MELEGKISVITGGASGIGKATVIRFLEEGASVVFCDKNVEAGERMLQELQRRSYTGTVRFFGCDVGQEEEVKKLAEYVKKEFGNCQILFNNAGLHYAGKLHETRPADWDRVMNVDLRGVYLMCYHFLPQMLEESYGSIINMSSVSGICADTAMCAYNTAKGAVTNMTRAMALDYADNGIRVNAVCPGCVRTEIAQHTFDSVAGAEERFQQAYPIHRIIEPIEIAEAVVFLASRKADYINGVNLPIDGGITVHTGQPDTGKY